MPSYSAEFKEQIARKMIAPNAQTVAELSRETGISEPTLYAWRKQFQARGCVEPKRPTTVERWDAKAKLACVIQTAVMNAAERAAYCREHGLYPEQLDEWKSAFEAMGTAASPAERAALANERRKSKRLEKELRRKERALAEAAALLTLSKKAQAIWGVDEED